MSGTPVLLIDDDVRLSHLLGEYLAQEGLQLVAEHTGEMGLVRLEKGTFALVILDLMLPYMDGFDVLARIRHTSSVPVLMLTTRQATRDRVIGLQRGADDYLVKPFAPEELLARVQAILRRSGHQPDLQRSIVLGDLTIRIAQRQVLRDNRVVPLSSAEFDALLCLAQQPGQAVSRERLCRQALRREMNAQDRGIDNLISDIRGKLGALPDGQQRIRNVRGHGYLYPASE